MRPIRTLGRLLPVAALLLAAGCACTWTPAERSQVETWKQIVRERGEGTWEPRVHSWHT